MRNRRYLLETAAMLAMVSICIGLPRPALTQAALPTGGSVILPAPEPPFGGVINRKASEFEIGLPARGDRTQRCPERPPDHD